MSKAYAHKTGNRLGDLYDTPKSLIWVAEDIIKDEFGTEIIYDPACGNYAILQALAEIENSACNIGTDLYNTNQPINYLSDEYSGFVNSFKYIITNPPFSLWDEFVLKAKTHCKKFMFIGRLNYFGTNGRYRFEIWNNLKAIYPFNRYIDYQTPYREDGLFHVGAMATAWFLWDMKYTEMWKGHVLDVQKYARLGNFNKEFKK